MKPSMKEFTFTLPASLFLSNDGTSECCNFNLFTKIGNSIQKKNHNIENSVL